jgi:hypothetical protein
VAAAGGFAKSPAPAFNAASIKPHREGDVLGYFQFLPGGRLHVTNTWIKNVIEREYDLKGYQVSGLDHVGLVRYRGQSRRCQRGHTADAANVADLAGRAVSTEDPSGNQGVPGL